MRNKNISKLKVTKMIEKKETSVGVVELRMYHFVLTGSKKDKDE